MHYYKYVWR